MNESSDLFKHIVFAALYALVILVFNMRIFEMVGIVGLAYEGQRIGRITQRNGLNSFRRRAL